MNVYCDNCGCRADRGTPTCPVDDAPMRARDLPAPPAGFVQVDHTFTPQQAARIIASVPEDSYHWRDIPRKAPDAIDKYTRIMAAGEWRNETYEAGYYEHPIRWDGDGQLTHGIMRLLACRDSGRPFTAAVYAPQGLLEELCA